MKPAIDKKLKTLLVLPILILSAFAVLGAAPIRPAYAQAVASLLLAPEVIKDTCNFDGTGCTMGFGPGNMFQYTVTATGVGGTEATIFAYQFEIHYNPSIIQAASVDSFGPFFGPLIASGMAFPATSIDNSAGVVSMAVTSLGPQSRSIDTTLVLGQVSFNIVGVGRSDQTIENAILLHDLGGGTLSNIPVSTQGALFSNPGLFGLANFPSVSSGLRSAFPEELFYSPATDSFTPGINSLFGNINSSGTLPVVAYVQFTVTSVFGTVVLKTPTQTLGPGQVTIVPLVSINGFNPNPTGAFLQLGTFNVAAQVFYQQVNLDNTLGPLTPGGTMKSFHFVVAAADPTTTSVSCSPATDVTRRTLCTAVVGAVDPPHLTGVVSFQSNIAGIFKPTSCAPNNKGICSVFFYPRSTGAMVTAFYSGDASGRSGHTGSSGFTTVTVTGHTTSVAVTCSPGTVNAPTRGSSTCTATVTDTSGTPTTVTGTVVFKSNKASFWDFSTIPTGLFIFPTCDLVPTGVIGVSSCTITYRANRNNAATCNPSAGCMATISASYGVSNRPSSEVPDSSAPADADHLTSETTTTIGITGHQTSTTVKCSPGGVPENGTTTCTVTVTDIDSLSPTTPTGTVLFGHGPNLGSGGFSSTTCTLVEISPGKASCSVNWTASTGPTETLIIAAYLNIGDSTHVRTSGTTIVKTIA